MDQPFKFRFVNEITGVFVLLCAAAMIVGVFLAGRAQGLFEPKLTLRTLLSAKEGSFGLREGTEVRILDTAAGTVKRVMPNASGQIEAVFVVKGSFHSFIRTSSKAVVKKKFAIAGDAYVEITAGDAKDPMLPDGGMIVCEKDTEIIGQIMKILEEAQQVAVESMQKVQMVLDELPWLTVQARQTMQQTEELMKNTDSFVRNEAPTVAVQAQDTMRETQLLMEGLQRHWLLRKYVDEVQGEAGFSPSAVGPIRLGGEQ